jgi:hypothetical protein
VLKSSNYLAVLEKVKMERVKKIVKDSYRGQKH